MPLSLNLSAAVGGIIELNTPLNVKLHGRVTTKLEDKLYNFVP